MSCDYNLACADEEADRRGQDSAMEAWLEQRVREVMADPELLEDAFDCYADCDDYDLIRDVAFEAANGTTDAQKRLYKRMQAVALAWAKADWRDRG